MLRRPPFPRVSAATADRAAARLERELGSSKVLAGRDVDAAYGGDESEQEPVAPDAVVRARSVDDIAKTLRIAAELEVPVTPRGGGSGKSGGAVPVAGGIVLAMEGMASIKDIDRDEGLAVVEPGLVLASLHTAVEAEGLFYPPDPNSAAMCTLGGNIAENAAGPRAFKYGVTREYVRGLEVLTMDGERLRLGRRTAKGVTGYDLTALMVGSEGTLAVVTEATLRLVPKPPEVVTLLALFADARASGRAVSALIAAGVVPRCIELLDRATLEAVRRRGVSVDARAGAMLLIEVDGDAMACEAAMQRVGDVCTEASALDVLVAQDGAQRARLWEARKQLSPTTRAMARHKIAEDVVVPRMQIPSLLDEIERISEATGIPMLTYGHAGDGNLHTTFLWNDDEASPRVEEGLTRLFRSVIALGGTLTGEHGVGTSKAAYLPLEQAPELIALQRRIKALFDPKGLLNPGKIFPRAGHGGC